MQTRSTFLNQQFDTKFTPCESSAFTNPTFENQMPFIINHIVQEHTPLLFLYTLTRLYAYTQRINKFI